MVKLRSQLNPIVVPLVQVLQLSLGEFTFSADFLATCLQLFHLRAFALVGLQVRSRTFKLFRALFDLCA